MENIGAGRMVMMRDEDVACERDQRVNTASSTMLLWVKDTHEGILSVLIDSLIHTYRIMR